MEDARKAIRRLGAESYLTDDIVEAKAALIEHTIEMEAAETAGSGWKELFHGTNRRRTEIVSRMHKTLRSPFPGVCRMVLPVLVWTTDQQLCH